MSAAGPGQCSGWSEWKVMAYYLHNVHTLARRIHQQPRWLPLNVATFTHFIIHTTLPSVNVLHITSIITATEALLKEKSGSGRNVGSSRSGTGFEIIRIKKHCKLNEAKSLCMVFKTCFCKFICHFSALIFKNISPVLL